MNSYQEALRKFIKMMGYLENDNVEGIVFYGSYLTGYNTKDSDLDLQIIFNNDDLNHLIRGYQKTDDFIIEYYEKPIQEIYARAMNDFKNQSNVLLSTIGHGQILFDRNGNIKKLQDYVLQLYSMPLPGLTDDEAKDFISFMNNKIKHLIILYEEKNPYFFHLYPILVDRIRSFYHQLYGFPELSISRVNKLYHDNTGYREKTFKNIPEQEFINLFDQASLNHSKGMKEHMEALNKLYSYVTRDISFDSNNYRVKIKSTKI